jgi:hypothetical protein
MQFCIDDVNEGHLVLLSVCNFLVENMVKLLFVDASVHAFTCGFV